MFRTAKKKSKRPRTDVDAPSEVAPQDESKASSNIQTQPDVQEDEIITFKSLGLSDWLCSVCRSLGMAYPTEVQRGCIPGVLAGQDVIGLAQTGSGKTAAFALPILQSLARDPYGVFALTLIPTRELAIQIAEQYRALGAGMSLKECTVIGGVDMQQQTKELARRPHIVVATPGRLKGLLDADSTLKASFSRVKFLVLDEADRLLEPSFADELRTILSALPPQGRQTLLFSATMTKSLIDLQAASLQNALVFKAYEGIKTADRLKEEYIFIPDKVKEVYLVDLLDRLQELKVRSAIIFCSTCKGCHLLSIVLEQLGIPAASLHSGKPQKQRIAALSAFKSEIVPLLLATDVASRGLDIPTVDLVINFDLPSLPRDYVHRVGRTARAGRSGWSLSFICQHDVELVHKIEDLIGHKLVEFKTDESKVLKGITRVYAAKRAALLNVAEEEGADPKDRRIKKILKSNGKSVTMKGMLNATY